LVATAVNCAPPLVWTLDGTCDPNLCPPPPAQGACCNTITGSCTVTTELVCVAPLVWRGAGVPCNAQSCSPVIPVERSSWGQIKNLYR
jgi:hypothetical protein